MILDRPVRMFAAFLATAFLMPASMAQKSEAPAGYYSGGQHPDDILPPDFRGRITYEGRYTAEVFRPGAVSPNANQRMRNIARRNDRSWTDEGTITIDVSFNGNAISGSVNGSVRGGSGTGRSTFTGTRNGRICTFTEPNGATNTARCDRSFWGSESRTAQGARQSAVIRIDARATQFVDAAVEEQQQREAAARAAEQARQRQLAEAEAERQRTAYAASPAGRREAAQRIMNNPQPRPSGGSSRSQSRNSRPASQQEQELFARAVDDDATNWSWNILDNNSGSDVRAWSEGRGITFVRANYTYNGETPGWVIARISQGQVQCLEYHDRNGSCDPPRPRRDQQGGDRAPRCYRPIIGNDPNTAPIYGSMRCD